MVGHSDEVTCVAVSLNDKAQVISGCKDMNLIVWDVDTGGEVFTLTGHSAPVTCVAISADSLVAVSGKLVSLVDFFFILGFSPTFKKKENNFKLIFLFLDPLKAKGGGPGEGASSTYQFKKKIRKKCKK